MTLTTHSPWYQILHQSIFDFDIFFKLAYYQLAYVLLEQIYYTNALCSMVVIKSLETELFNPRVDACLSCTYQDSIFRLRGGAPRLRRPRRRPDWQIPSSNEECDESYAGDFANHRSSCDSEWVPDDSSVSSGEKSAGKLIRLNFSGRIRLLVSTACEIYGIQHLCFIRLIAPRNL